MSRIFVATRKGLMVYSESNGQISLESKHFLGDPVSSVAVDSSGHWFVALNLGHFGPKLHVSEDEGTTWQETACPQLPEKPKNNDEKGDWQVKQIWVLEALKTPGHLIAGTIPGAIFESKDGAKSWQLNNSLWTVPQRPQWFGGGFDESGVHSISVDTQQPSYWTAAISVGGVWHSENSGKTWKVECAGMRADYMPEDMVDSDDLQDPHRLVRAPSDPNRMWVQHHCGIFVSDDAGKNWRECFHNNVSSFGFAAAVHPKDADTAWFVPAIKDESRYPKDGQLKVIKTTNGGKSFTEITQGLPQEDSYDLVYRHALDVSLDGEMLCMGSTTGNLWASLDGGASWQTISHHLPPIYAVTVF
jgi:photosystem II stability/assembly factor-like uncharacterized protein